MSNTTFHIPDQQLLLHMDGELSAHEAARVLAHLGSCTECHTRSIKIKSAVAALANEQQRASTPTMDASGPRALLKARLAESAQAFQSPPRMHLRFARGLAYVSALALLITIGVEVLHHRSVMQERAYARLLPDPSITPGSTREVTLNNLCSEVRDEVVRNVPNSLQQKVFQEYGIHGIPASEFEVDYLITPGLGGSDDVRNLWPEPHNNGAWNSYVKDQLEDHLHRMVCDHQLSLSEAQRDIADNWIAAYKKYFHTDQPLPGPSPTQLSQI
jgi:anti-sigma factor RsiW